MLILRNDVSRVQSPIIFTGIFAELASTIFSCALRLLCILLFQIIEFALILIDVGSPQSPINLTLIFIMFYERRACLLKLVKLAEII